MTTKGRKRRAQVKGGKTGCVPALIATSNRLGCNPWAVGVPELLFFFFFYLGRGAFFFSSRGSARTKRRDDKNRKKKESPPATKSRQQSPRDQAENEKSNQSDSCHSFPLIVDFFSGHRSWTLPSPVAASAVCSHQPSAIAPDVGPEG